MSVCGWYVIKFVNEKNTIEVIPNNWMKNFDNCLWPNNIGLLKMQSAIKNRLPPSNNWISYPIKMLCTRMFSNYNEASRFANSILAQSSSETDQIHNSSLKGSIKRKKTIATNLVNKKDFQDSDPSSSDDEQNIVPPFPNCPSK